MNHFKHTLAESKRRWDLSAHSWDAGIDENTNGFHHNLVRDRTEELLDAKPGDQILDIGCGNGNFSYQLAKKGARVTAFDYSENMIAHAKARWSEYLDVIDFQVCDAADYEQVLSLKRTRPYDKAVASMAFMSMAVITPLIQAVYALLKVGGCLVFSVHHPCFIKPDQVYLTACLHEKEALPGLPVKQIYYHRPLQSLLETCFTAGFVLNKYLEVTDVNPETPHIVIMRMVKIHS